MIKPFWQSRKFILLGLDGLAALLVTVGAWFGEADSAGFLLRLFAVLTMAVVAVILSIAVEDYAALAAGTHPSQMVGGDHMARDKVGDDAAEFGVVYGDVTIQ